MGQFLTFWIMVVLTVREPDLFWFHVSDKNWRVRSITFLHVFCMWTLFMNLFFPDRSTRLFCDVYNPQSKTYCKRLQVLCPEHSRDPKVSGNRFLSGFILYTTLILPKGCLYGAWPLFLLFRCQWMKCVVAPWLRMSLSWRENTAGSPKGNATNITTGKNSGGQK